MNEHDQEAARILNDWICEHTPLVLRTAFYYVQDRMIAEDIAQEVFLRAYRHMADFRGASDVKTWLYRIAANVSKDYLRSWNYRKTVLAQALFRKETAESAEQEALSRIHTSELARQVLALPVKYREVIVLYYFEQLKSREIAALLDLNESTVRVRLARGIGKLKQEMKGGEAAWNL